MGNYSQGLNFPRSYLFKMDVLELKDANQVTEPNEGDLVQTIGRELSCMVPFGHQKNGEPSARVRCEKRPRNEWQQRLLRPNQKKKKAFLKQCGLCCHMPINAIKVTMRLLGLY